MEYPDDCYNHRRQTEFQQLIIRRAGVGTPVIAAAAIVVVVILACGFYFYSGFGSGGGNSTTSQAISLSFTHHLTLEAGGSSFVNPIMQTWIFAFQSLTKGQISTDYTPLGSGAGITGIFKNLYDFAGSDAPVPKSLIQPNATSGGTLLQIPEALGSVAILYNIPGVAKPLNLTGQVLEQIYLQGITKWNDPAIAELNPGISLPGQGIVPVHRSDGSGTTYALTTYFSRIDSSWVGKVGIGTSVSWPNSPNPELAGKGSGGVAAMVNQTANSIGYADSYYAISNGIKTAAIKNLAGVFVRPTVEGAAAAAAADGALVQANATYSITNAPGASSYAISTFTYLLVWQSQSSAEKAEAMTTFFWWAIHSGQSYSPRLYYAPLPSSVVTLDEGLIRQINYNGHSYAP